MSSRLLVLGAAAVLLLSACAGDGDGEGGGGTQARTDAAPGLTTELWSAARAGDVAEARRLLEAGADPNELDPAGESAFLLAASRPEDDPALVELMLEHGGDVRATDQEGNTALLRAAPLGNEKVIGAILEADPPIDHVNQLGWSALQAAVILGDGTEPYVRTVERLLEAGADPELGDAHGITPLVHAETAGHREIARLLREAGAG